MCLLLLALVENLLSLDSLLVRFFFILIVPVIIGLFIQLLLDPLQPIVLNHFQSFPLFFDHSFFFASYLLKSIITRLILEFQLCLGLPQLNFLLRLTLFHAAFDLLQLLLNLGLLLALLGFADEHSA